MWQVRTPSMFNQQPSHFHQKKKKTEHKTSLLLCDPSCLPPVFCLQVISLSLQENSELKAIQKHNLEAVCLCWWKYENAELISHCHAELWQFHQSLNLANSSPA